jgi:phosphoserine phosphatase RsbU/P
LLDVSGHGVGSSLLAVSVANLLASQSLPNTDCRDPGMVLARLNDIFPMEKQHGKYFTTWYGVFNRPSRSLSYSNAGHPPGLLFTGASAADATLHELKSSGLASGMLEGSEYDSEVLKLGPFARLMLYSDGAYEIALPSGAMWKLPEFVQYVSGLPRETPVADTLLTHVRQLGQSDSLADDFSVLEVWL